MTEFAASARQIASDIAAAHRAREKFESIAALRGDVALAYAAQDALLAQWQSEGGGDIIGWKIGLTTPHMQKMAGIDQPVAGAILSSRTHECGARIAASDFVRFGVECEITMRLGQALPLDRPYAPERVLACLDSVCAAFELIDDRGADYSELDAHSLIADNSWNAGVVFGEALPAGEFGALLGLCGRLSVNGVETDSGMSDAVAGDPLSVVDWVARSLAARGRSLEVGQWVMTGSLVTTKFPKPGERYHFSVDRLPSVEMDVV